MLGLLSLLSLKPFNSLSGSSPTSLPIWADRALPHAFSFVHYALVQEVSFIFHMKALPVLWLRIYFA